MSELDWADPELLALADELRDAEPCADVKRKMYMRDYYLRNRERQLARQRERRAENPELIRERQRGYDRRRRDRKQQAAEKRLRYHSDSEYREQVLAQQREYRANMSDEQREHVRMVKRAYAEAHREQTREAKRRYSSKPEVKERRNRLRRERDARMRVEDPERYRAMMDRKNMLRRERRRRKREAALGVSTT